MPPAIGIHCSYHSDERLVAAARAEEEAHVTGGSTEGGGVQRPCR